MKQHTGAIAVLVLIAACMGACKQETQSTDSSKSKSSSSEKQQEEFKTLEDRFSYAYGADLAAKFKQEGIELNLPLLMEGMKAEFAGADMKMSVDEVRATLQIFEEVHLKKKEAEKAAAGEKNKKEGEAFLAANAKKEGVVVTKSGLQYKVLKEGEGGYKPTIEDEVTVHYRGTFIDGTEFDSTHSRNKPYSAKAKQLIQGWTEALQMMSKGAKWELYVPAELAYGENGSDPYIGPNAVLIFQVELIDIEKYKAPE